MSATRAAEADLGERAQRRLGGEEIEQGRPGRDQHEMGRAQRLVGRGAQGPGGVEDDEVEAAPRERGEDLRNCPTRSSPRWSTAGSSARAACGPGGERALRVEVEGGDASPGLMGGDCEVDGHRGLAGAALLGGDREDVHHDGPPRVGRPSTAASRRPDASASR